MNERKTALDILTDIKKGVPSQTALQNMPAYMKEGARPEKKTRSFITALVYGTLENYIYLDHIITVFTGKPVNKLKPFIATLLEMSVYQLIFMENIPDHAVVNEAVRIVERSPQKGLKGFINGVLRNIARNRNDLPAINGDGLCRLSLEYSLPDHIITMISDTLDRYGGSDNKTEISLNPKTGEVLAGLRKRRPLTIRCNTLLITPSELEEKLKKEGVTVTKDPVLPGYAFNITGYDSIDSLQSFNDGLFYVQDTGSILSGEASGFMPGEKVLDLCAAPGGKTIGAAMAGAVVESKDISIHKTGLIRENVRRLKLKEVSVSEADAAVFDPELEESFDCVIADVPCSGTGIIGRKPDIALHLQPDGIKELVSLQRDILKNAERYVKKGGRLIYSTCTIDYLENKDNARLVSVERFEKIFERQWFPGIDGDTDGFYTAVFKRIK